MCQLLVRILPVLSANFLFSANGNVLQSNVVQSNVVLSNVVQSTVVLSIALECRALYSRVLRNVVKNIVVLNAVVYSNVMQRTAVQSRIMWHLHLSEKPSGGRVNGQLVDLDKFHQLRYILLAE